MTKLKKLASYFTKETKKFVIFLSLLIAANIFIWNSVIGIVSPPQVQIYFFDVGQGDSELIRIEGRVDILVDGGPAEGNILKDLSQALPLGDRYLDLVAMTHPQSDHGTGLIKVLDYYKTGLFLHSGKKGDSKFLNILERKVARKTQRSLQLYQGDLIKYKDYVIEIISPEEAFLDSSDSNESSLVMNFKVDGFNTLFTGDITKKIERKIIENLPASVDVLKVPHHGSKYSSSPTLLKKIEPAISVIEVGSNSYGHPSPKTLSRLRKIGSNIFRTDKYGTVKIEYDSKRIKVFSQD
ncbi:MAG: ComEC/Rec2 family competence protein [Candidatus Magasanikbacteria bacterium]